MRARYLLLSLLVGVVGAFYVLLFRAAGPDDQPFVIFFSLVAVLVLSRRERRA
jgi:hypothetical protein